jgi:hypothetical protein
MVLDASSASWQLIAMSCVVASSVILFWGMVPAIASTSLSASKMRAMLGVIVGIVRYLCLKKHRIADAIAAGVGDVNLMALIMLV